MDNAIAKILAFVEGRTEAGEFEQLLYNDPEIERALNDDPGPKPGTYVGHSTFLFVVQQDFTSPAGVLNVHGALAQFLERKGIRSQPTEAYAELYDLILDAQPRWLNVPVDWVKKSVLPAAGNRKGSELRDWLHDRLLELFRFRARPPRWIQSAQWPIGENGPLVFLGQLAIPDYFHDEAAAYVFTIRQAADAETVIQVN